jgi:hypothetical protein
MSLEDKIIALAQAVGADIKGIVTGKADTSHNHSNATTSVAGFMSAADKTKLDGVATNANNYTLPTATATVKGGIELFSNTVQSVAANPVTATASRTYGIQLNSAGQAVVNVPWESSTGGVELFSDTVQSVEANAVTATEGRTYGAQLNSAGQVVVNVPWTSGGDFVAITENDKTGYGTSYRAANPANYGNIGTQAVDLSYCNSSSTTRGATGDYSRAMGDHCTSSGHYSTAMGLLCSSSGQGSTAMGTSCTSSGQRSTAMGSSCTSSGFSSTAMGANCTSSGHYSTTIGSYANTNNIQSKLAIGASTTTLGRFQTGIITLGSSTNNATTNTMVSDQSTSTTTTNQLILPNNAAQAFRGLVVADGTGMAASWEITGLVRRGANASATVLVGSAVTKMYGDAGLDACTVALVVDTTNGGVTVTVTGLASTIITWTCSIWTAEAI